MKKLNLILMALLISANAINAQSKAETLVTFLDGIISFEGKSLDADTPIATIKELAAKQAELSMDLSKETVKEVFMTATNYHFCVITIGVHTVARIADLENCKQSGSWGTCMPWGEGYVQNGGLKNINDYLNNIIGTPSSKESKVYFFKKK